MILLFISSLSEYLTTSTASQMLIDDSPSELKLNVIFTIDFTKVPCEMIYTDNQDLLGFNAEDVKENIIQRRIIKGVVMQAPVSNRNQDLSYETIKQKVLEGEGCQIDGTISINKVPGNIHFSVHNEKMSQMLQRFSQEGIYLNFAHKIRHFAFGAHEHDIKMIQKRFPEIELFPLEGTSMDEDIKLSIAYQYYLNVVRTVVQFRGRPREVYQYTISKNYGITRDMPALFFKYEMSPLYVRYELKEKSIWHFIVNICAIIGGVYTAFSILDAVIYSSVSKIFKNRIGKLS